MQIKGLALAVAARQYFAVSILLRNLEKQMDNTSVSKLPVLSIHFSDLWSYAHLAIALTLLTAVRVWLCCPVCYVGVEGRFSAFKGSCEAKLGGGWLEGVGSLLTEVPQNKNRRLTLSRLLCNIEV